MEAKKIFGNWIVKNLIWALVLVTVLVIAASIGLRVMTNHGKEITVPDFTNMNVNEAKYNAGLVDIRAEVTDSVYIRRMGRGLVYSQNPKAGSKVKKGRRVMLTINSVTPKKVQMPNLVGYSMRQAKAELLSRGLNPGKLIYVSDMATNNVLRQLRRNREIAPGTMVESGSTIDLVVGLSSNDNQTYVPDVSGMKFLRAVDAVHDYSLNIKTLHFDEGIKTYADSLDAVVYKQTPSPSRNPMLMGSDVNLYLSKDPLKQPSK
ncbi:MAG: PASTA domain-containing protein [Bacteroidales bacterium]|nr:PASTA domain-containing protein [Bacteroidales bacterium]